MSFSDLERLCEAASNHLESLPDVRENRLLSHVHEEWNPLAQVQSELASLKAELSSLIPELRLASRCCETALILSDIMTGSDYLYRTGAPIFSAKQRDLLSAFYLEYPAITWILLANYPTAVLLYSYSNFIFYVMSELDDEYWKPHPDLLEDSGIAYPMSRSCAKYLLWKRIFYFPTETIDPLHDTICKKLFSRHSSRLTYASAEISNNNFLTVILRFLTSRQRKTAACCLPASLSDRNLYTLPLGQRFGISEDALQHICLDADSMLIHALILHKRLMLDEFPMIFRQYLRRARLEYGGSIGAILKFSSALTAHKKWWYVKSYFEYMFDHQSWESSSWDKQVSPIDNIVTRICCGIHISPFLANMIQSRGFYHQISVERVNAEHLPSLLDKILTHYFQVKEIAPQENSGFLPELKVVWKFLSVLSASDIVRVFSTTEQDSRLREVIRDVLEADNKQDQALTNILMTIQPLSDLFFYGWLVANWTLALDALDDTEEADRADALSRIGERIPALCEMIYSYTHYHEKATLSVAFYKTLIAHRGSADALFSDAKTNHRLYKLLAARVGAFYANPDPLFLVADI